jgi:hypothetical protein
MASTTNSVSGAASTILFPNRSAAEEASPRRMTSPGKSVAPTGIGVPFSFASLPVMLVAEAAGSFARVAPNASEQGAAAQNRIPARKSRPGK